MATAKTGSFYLTETVTLPTLSADGSRVQATLDLGAYVNVPTGQAIAIDQVDYVWQTFDGGSNPEQFLAANGAISVQLTDLNPGTTLILADGHSLISSGAMAIDVANNIASHVSDIYPDNFGPNSLSEAFMVVNDTLYLVAGNDGAAVGAADVYVTVRVRARVVKLGSKDWMAIAIQSTASDS
jgi:hypothetical protein